MNSKDDFLKIQNWYPVLSKHTFPTRFVPVSAETAAALASGKFTEKISHNMRKALESPMQKTPGNCFTLVDCCAPTDTDRYKVKRGAVHSPRSAWRYLCASEKVRAAAAAGDVSCIAVRPFRRMSKPREFRLFIYDGKLSAMSQYHLIRHFRRLEKVRERFWKQASRFVESIIDSVPLKTFVMDIYFTSDEAILILDLNPWGTATDPLLLKTWKRDWETPAGIVLMAPPTPIGGNVKVSF